MRSIVIFTSILLCLSMGQVHSQSLLPPGYAEVTLVNHDGSELYDYMFTEALNWDDPQAGSLSLLFDRKGEIAWFQQSVSTMTNFALLGDGRMSYFSQGEHLFLDSTFQIVGGMGCDNGELNDAHDLIITPDGRVFMLCLEQETTDLSMASTLGGKPGASSGTLLTTIIQELDLSGNLVKEWRGRPYYTLADSDPAYFTDTTKLDLNHPNSLDWDGKHILLSSRNVNEIMLIEWDSGNIVWRFGGVHNDFGYDNDLFFRGQHDARFLGNNRISVFDNGWRHFPPRTRGVVYELDTVNWKATAIEAFTLQNNVSRSMGGFRQLPNGDYLRSNGYMVNTGHPNISLIHPNGQHGIDISYEPGSWSYRAQCFDPDWELPRPTIQCEPFGSGLRLSLSQTYSSYLWSNGSTSADIVVTTPGSYQVFVPYGVGMMGSYTFHATSANSSCPLVSTPEPQNPTARPAKLIRTVDLMGREVAVRKSGHVYVEVYSDGNVRKVLQD